MTPPLKEKMVLALDPAYRTGCKIAIIDSTGKLLDTTTVYPTEPQNDVEGAKKELLKLIEKDKIDMEIHENIEEVSYLFTMRSSYLFSSACEECIIYNIKEDSYDIIQKLGGLEGDTTKSIELDNGDIICLFRGFYIFKAIYLFCFYE